MRIAYDNVLDNVDVLSYTGQNANYPVTNVLNSILTTSWRTLVCTTAQTITFDAGVGATFTCTSCFVSGHNLTNSATIKFQMNATDAWGAPSVDETLTWRATHIYKYFATQSYRFIRFSFTDITNPDTFIEIGRLFAGTYKQFSPSSNLPFKITNIRSDVVTETDIGSVYGTPGIKLKQYDYDFSNATDTEIEAIRTIYDTIGNYKTCYLANLDSTFTHNDILYCRILNNLEETVKGDKLNDYSCSFKECK